MITYEEFYRNSHYPARRTAKEQRADIDKFLDILTERGDFDTMETLRRFLRIIAKKTIKRESNGHD